MDSFGTIKAAPRTAILQAEKRWSGPFGLSLARAAHGAAADHVAEVEAAHIRRRRLLALAVGAGLASPSAQSQSTKRVRRIGVLWENDPAFYFDYLDSFLNGMRELGHVEGRDFLVEQRTARNDVLRLPALAAEMVRSKVDLIIPSGAPAAIATREATRDLPILIVTVGDPVASGLAASFRRPGGNVSGLTSMSAELDPKRLDLLRQIVPRAARVGLLYSPENHSDIASLPRFDSACAALGISAALAPVRRVEDFPAAFETMVQGGVQGLVVTSSGQNGAWRHHIIELAARFALPTVYGRGYFAEAGGLIAYGANFSDLWRRAALYADKIFKGEKPADIPIEQPTKFEMTVNLRTARAIGLQIPSSILLRADRVIE